mmetsp:Transcript_38835/g.97568  ORF Transcript_38835/g.97568 Transcript_38835/m.97568 type:complete len:899 (-) Transcript_38835:276-2972(-)
MDQGEDVGQEPQPAGRVLSWPRRPASASDPRSQNLELGRDAVGADLSSPLTASLHRTFREAQRNCDSLVLSAKEHPRVKGLTSELERRQESLASLKSRAQERFASLKDKDSDLLKQLSQHPAAQPILGMRRVVSENSIPLGSSPTQPLGGKLLPVGEQHYTLGDQSTSVPSLMMTVQRTVASARSAAETHASAVLAGTAMLRAAMVPPSGLDSALAAGGSTTEVGLPGRMTLEQMMAKPLAVLQRAQQVAESSYRETHAQVHQLMAHNMQLHHEGKAAKFTTAGAAGILSPSVPVSDDWQQESQRVIVSLTGNKHAGGESQGAASLGVDYDPAAGPTAGGKEDVTTMAEWKKWLMAFELRDAQDSAAELAGEIDKLDGQGKTAAAGDSQALAALPAGGTRRASEGGSEAPPKQRWPGLVHWLRRPRHGSSLRDEGRKVAIVTTAALPWMTGTAVNPLLRAVYLAKDSAREVTLVIPWLTKADQASIFPNVTFDSPEQQEQYVREWARKRTGVDTPFKVQFYPGKYAPEKGSILPVGDLTQYIPDAEADVAVLEEPEHLNWYHHGRCWTDKFQHVVGIVHTNYLDYARREEGGDIKEGLLRAINQWVCQAHCHKVVKLSGAVQSLPKEHTEFVHGVSPAFLDVGVSRREPLPGSDKRFSQGFYFIGKVVWAKGYTELLDMVKHHRGTSGEELPVDVYGGGPDLDDVRSRSSQNGLSLKFHGPKDHLSPDIHEYKAFINPSTSDVVATTSAEALAMGKFVICCEHPSNQFFSQFQNCLIYRSPAEFSEKVRYAMAHEPKPLSEEEKYKLTWEAATERFLDIASLSAQERHPGIVGSALDALAYHTHNAFSGFEPMRVTAGAHPGTRDNPETVTSFVPAEAHSGGLLDRKAKPQPVAQPKA